MGDPITTGLLVASAATTAAGLGASRQQAKLEQAQLRFESEQAKLEATDQALAQTKSFRQALASQLAISSLRSGGGSLVRQFSAQSVANFLQDQNVLDKRKRFIDVAAQTSRAQIASNRFSRDVSSIGSLLSGSIDAINFSGTSGKLQGEGL